MHINLETLRDAVRRGIITEKEAVSVWMHLQVQQVPRVEHLDRMSVAPLPVAPPRRPTLVSALSALVPLPLRRLLPHRARSGARG